MKEISFIPQTRAEGRAVLAFAKETGIEVYSKTWERFFGKSSAHRWSDYKYLQFKNDGSLSGAQDCTVEKVVTFNEFINGIADSMDNAVKLNDDYMAEILDGKVKVGCQEISFEAIEKLMEKINKVKSKQ